jgi:KRAB domain-containing zinc finger protein
METQQDIKHDNNPWCVESIEEFLYFCCPECPDKSQSKDVFISHALDQHPKAHDVLPSLNVEVKLLKVEVDIKQQDGDSKVKIESNEELQEDFSVEQDITSENDEIFAVEQDYNEGEDSDPDFKMENEDEHDSDPDFKIEKEDLQVQCYYCGEMMCQPFLRDHQVDKHGGFCCRMFGKPRSIQCSKCKGTFQTESALGLHDCYDIFIPKKKYGEPYKCEKCSKEFKDRKTFRYHLQTAHTDQKNFQCTQCSYSTKTSSLLTGHVKRVHEKLLPNMCPECGRRFYRFSSLKQHIHKIHGTKKCNLKPVEFKCEKCEASFDLKLRLTKHLQCHHGIEPERKYTCEECGNSFTQVSSLQDHMKSIHPSDKELAKIECICLVCQAQFETSINLNEHQINRHNMSDVKSCNRCETHWTSVETLQKHVAETHKLIVFPCELCDKTFTQPFSKRSHITRTHTRSTEVQCKQCPKVFVHQDRLKIHMRAIHGDGGDFKCEFCNYRAVKKSKLELHVQATHIKKIRYECELKPCKFFSYRKDGLTMHIKFVHERQKNHKCELCDMAFFARRDKIKHMKKHV